MIDLLDNVCMAESWADLAETELWRLLNLRYILIVPGFDLFDCESCRGVNSCLQHIGACRVYWRSFSTMHWYPIYRTVSCLIIVLQCVPPPLLNRHSYFHCVDLLHSRRWRRRMGDVGCHINCTLKCRLFTGSPLAILRALVCSTGIH